MSSASPSAPAVIGPTVWLVLGNIFRNLGLLAILISLTWLTDAAAVGRYAFALALTTPTFAFAFLGLRGVYLTHRRATRFGVYLIVQLLAIAGATAVSLVVAWIVDPSLVVPVLLVAIIKSADTVSDLCIGPLQRAGSSVLAFWGFLASAAAGAVAVVIALRLTSSLEIALGAIAIVSIAVAIAFFVFPAVRVAPRVEGSILTDGVGLVLRAGLPSGVALFLLALVPTVPQYFLAGSQGEVVVGHFAVVLYLFAAADLVVGTVSQAWLPRGRHEFQGLSGEPRAFASAVLRVSGRWTAALLPVTVGGLLLAGWLYPLVFPGYRVEFDTALPIAVAIMALPTLYFSTAAIAVRNLYVHNLTLGSVSAAVSVAACAVLVPAFALEGALWATAIAVTARAIAAVIVLRAATQRPVGSGQRREVVGEPEPQAE